MIGTRLSGSGVAIWAMLTLVGMAQAGSVLIGSSVSDHLVTPIIGESNISPSFTIPANSVSQGDVIEVVTCGFYENTATTTPRFNFKVKIGGNVRALTGFFTPDNTTESRGFRHSVSFVVRSTGASGTIIPQQLLTLAIDLPYRCLTDNSSSLKSINTTVSNTIQAFVENDTSSSGGWKLTGSQFYVIHHKP